MAVTVTQLIDLLEDRLTKEERDTCALDVLHVIHPDSIDEVGVSFSMPMDSDEKAVCISSG